MTLGTAITSAMLAVVVAVPCSVHGQSTPLNAPGSEIELLPWSGSSDRISVQTCLRFGLCLDDAREAPGSDPANAGLDRTILFGVHGWNSRTATRVFGTADASAYPVFVAAPLALWGSMITDHVSQGDALAGTVALAAGFGTTMVLKRIVGRPRPYAVIDGFSARSDYSGSRGLSETASFPSGHATLAGIIATGAALLIRHPAATAGAALWAGTVSVSRVWLGVHYPTDVLTGVALGSGASLLSYSILQ